MSQGPVIDELLRQIIQDAAETYRGWLAARLTSQAERQLAMLKLHRCESLIGCTPPQGK